VIANYVAAREIVKEGGRTSGVEAEDTLTGKSFRIAARVVINATGIFTDETRRLDSPAARPVMRWSRGTHVVLDRDVLPGGNGLLVPETGDGRVVFALPWLGSTLVGTTDVPVSAPDKSPEPPAEDVEFLLTELGRHLPSANGAAVRAAFCGLRPLVATAYGRTTASLARTHRVLVSESGMVTITGGKWTTARLMAEDTVDVAERTASLQPRSCLTKSLRVHGYLRPPAQGDAAHISEPDSLYGQEQDLIASMESDDPSLTQPLAPGLPYRRSHAVFEVRQEMAQTLEDVLARRTRAAFLNSDAASTAAPEVASLIAGELGHDSSWAEQQARSFTA
jgi:glycerol-3-phosphate dehydrogenase